MVGGISAGVGNGFSGKKKKKTPSFARHGDVFLNTQILWYVSVWVERNAV